MKDGKKIPIVETSDPQKPATRYPTKVAVITTGPGLIIPIATATRNCRGSSQPYSRTSPCSRKGTITRPLPKVSEPALRKKSRSLPRVEADATGASCANTGTAVICSTAGGRTTTEQVPVIQNANDAGAD